MPLMMKDGVFLSYYWSFIHQFNNGKVKYKYAKYIFLKQTLRFLYDKDKEQENYRLYIRILKYFYRSKNSKHYSNKLFKAKRKKIIEIMGWNSGKKT